MNTSQQGLDHGRLAAAAASRACAELALFARPNTCTRTRTNTSRGCRRPASRPAVAPSTNTRARTSQRRRATQSDPESASPAVAAARRRRRPSRPTDRLAKGHPQAPPRDRPRAGDDRRPDRLHGGQAPALPEHGRPQLGPRDERLALARAAVAVRRQQGRHRTPQDGRRRR